MGFNKEQIKAEAKRTYKSLVIDDAPGGKIELQNSIYLTDEARDAFKAKQAEFTELQSDETATSAQAKAVFVETLALLADKPDEWREYSEQFSVAELTAVFRMWAKETQAGEASPSQKK